MARQLSYGELLRERLSGIEARISFKRIQLSGNEFDDAWFDNHKQLQLLIVDQHTVESRLDNIDSIAPNFPIMTN